LISVYVPKDIRKSVEFRRIAASYAEAGDLSPPSGIDEQRSKLGSSLRLTLGSALALTVVDGKFLVVASKDGGSAAVFELPTMKVLGLIDAIENSLA
jgi:hypothetical protein